MGRCSRCFSASGRLPTPDDWSDCIAATSLPSDGRSIYVLLLPREEKPRCYQEQFAARLFLAGGARREILSVARHEIGAGHQEDGFDPKGQTAKIRLGS